MRSELVYKGCREFLETVHSSRVHGLRSRLVYKGCGECLEHVDPSRIHLMRSTYSARGAVNPWRVLPLQGFT